MVRLKNLEFAWDLGEWFKKGRLKVEMEMTGGDTAVDVDSQVYASVSRS